MTMIPLQDLLDKHTDPDTDILDLEALNGEMSDILAAGDTGVSPIDMLLIGERHADTMFEYLGHLFITFADEMGALPEGQEVELVNFQLYKTQSKLAAVYEMLRAKEEIEAARSGLVVPGQSSSIHPDQLTIDEVLDQKADPSE